jgi:hypothetical protein
MLDFRAEPMGPHFTKHHIGGMPFPAVIHHFCAVDLGDPHDHPAKARSVILAGGYCEEVFDPATGASERIWRRPGDSFVMEAAHVHRLVELPEGEAWTLYTPLGPKVQEPGFYEWREGAPWRRAWNGDWQPVSPGGARVAA